MSKTDTVAVLAASSAMKKTRSDKYKQSRTEFDKDVDL